MADEAHVWTAPYQMPRFRPADIDPAQPIRTALGYNAAGAWVWADEDDGRWPYGRSTLQDAHEMALRGLTDG